MPGLQHVGFGIETTYGTPVAATRFSEAISEGVKLVSNVKDLEVLRSYSAREGVLLGEVVQGPISIAAGYSGIEGLLLKHLFGSVTTDATATPVIKHTFPASGGIPAADRIGFGLTGEFRRGNSLVWNYAGMKLLNWKHGFKVDDFSAVDVDVLAKAEATGASAATPTYPALEPMLPQEVKTVSLNGGASLPVESVQVEIPNPLDQPKILGILGLGREPDRSGVLACTITMTGLFEAFADFYNLQGQYLDLEVMSRRDGTGFADATRAIQYNVNRFYIPPGQATPAMSGRERLKSTIVGKGYFNTTVDECVQVVIKNGNTTP